MTAGHRHRVIRLPPHGATLHLLRTPLLRTADVGRLEGSRWTWFADLEPVAGDGPERYATVYTLTPLGILHTLCGLTIDTRRQESP